MNGGIECENCTDTSTTGNCNLITTIATYDNSTVEDSCARGDQNGLGALFCEKTCDENLGGFCPNENEYRNCSTNGCPGITQYVHHFIIQSNANLFIYYYIFIILVNCTWNSWSAWETCSVSCGNGTQERNRTKSAAQHGGADCVGNDTESQFCNTNPCPGLV